MSRRKEVWRFPGDPTDRFGFPVLVADWCEWMGAHGYSPRTVENRARMLAHLAVWLDERGVSRPVDVTRPMLDCYQRWLFHYRKRDGDPLTFRSQSQRLLPVRAFFKWAARHHHLIHNPCGRHVPQFVPGLAAEHIDVPEFIPEFIPTWRETHRYR